MASSIPADLLVQDGHFMQLVLFSSVKGVGQVSVMDKSHAFVIVKRGIHEKRMEDVNGIYSMETQRGEQMIHG